MRLRYLMTPFAFALIGGAILLRRHRRRARLASLGRDERFAIDRIDPADPVQGLADPVQGLADPVQGIDEVAELQIISLEVDALSRADAEAAQDLADLASGIDETAIEDDAIVESAGIDETTQPRDAGDLYGAHTPRAANREHLDDDRAFDDGQNWLEALETSAVENGPEPERDLADIVDDEEVLRPPHPSDARDRPVADHGSGGRRGL